MEDAEFNDSGLGEEVVDAGAGDAAGCNLSAPFATPTALKLPDTKFLRVPRTISWDELTIYFSAMQSGSKNKANL